MERNKVVSAKDLDWESEAIRAKTLGSAPKPCEEPHLGLATTEQLLQELAARGRVEAVNFYQTAGRQLAEDCERLQRELPPEMRSYRMAKP